MTTDAYQLGAVTAILEDLIADLMGGDGDNHEITPGQAGGCVVCEAVARAETRLRAVQ